MIVTAWNLECPQRILFPANDILRGRFRKDTLYAIDDNNKEIRKLYVAQDYLNMTHGISVYAEAIMLLLLLVVFGWMVGGKYPQYQDFYVYSAKLLSLCLFVTSLVEFVTNIPVESSCNSEWTYLKFIKPITTKEVDITNDRPNMLDIIVAILQMLNKKYKQFKSLLP